MMAEVSASARRTWQSQGVRNIAGNMLAETTECANVSSEDAFGEAAIDSVRQSGEDYICNFKMTSWELGVWLSW